jgi:hypothetical protein
MSKECLLKNKKTIINISRETLNNNTYKVYRGLNYNIKKPKQIMSKKKNKSSPKEHRIFCWEIENQIDE